MLSQPVSVTQSSRLEKKKSNVHFSIPLNGISPFDESVPVHFFVKKKQLPKKQNENPFDGEITNKRRPYLYDTNFETGSLSLTIGQLITGHLLANNNRYEKNFFKNIKIYSFQVKKVSKAEIQLEKISHYKKK